jgi:Endopolygalacturonase
MSIPASSVPIISPRSAADTGAAIFAPEHGVPFPFTPPPALDFGPFETTPLAHGAVVGGQVSCTGAFARAIAECAERGGGTVRVPAGVWLTGPIHFRDGVRLHLETGATVRFSRNFSDYLPPVYSQRGGAWLFNYSPQLYARDVKRIAITGEGVLDGQGDAWWDWKLRQPGMNELFSMMARGVPIEERVFGSEAAGVRPPMLQFLDCRDILIEGVTFRNGPSWMLHPVRCDNVTIRGVTIYGEGHNNDGIDPDCCRNVLIEDCRIDAGDDCIVLKAGRDQDGWTYGRPTENVVVRRVTSRQGHGGFVIGSEISAGVRNVLVEDCDFANTERGIFIKSAPGRGGFIENIHVRRITMNRIHTGAVLIRLDYGNPARGEAGWAFASTTTEPTRVENIVVEDIRCGCFGAGRAVDISGDPRLPPRGIVLRNVSLRAKTGMTIADVEDLRMENVTVRPIC